MNWPSFWLGVFFMGYVTVPTIVILMCAVADDDNATKAARKKGRRM
jgi:hypothetical protein